MSMSYAREEQRECGEFHSKERFNLKEGDFEAVDSIAIFSSCVNSHSANISMGPGLSGGIDNRSLKNIIT
jgi:hypothetical protein